MRQANKSFTFTSDAHVVRICGTRATTLAELHGLLKTASDASIFHHTFQTLQAHHYLTEGFTNDFAQWVLAACNENTLAEQLTAVDVRDYISISALRKQLTRVTGAYIKDNPTRRDVPGFEPFYFCETVLVTVPTGVVARTLGEFAEGVKNASLSSIHFHFLTSRLRLQLETNDFSEWLRRSLDLPELAEQVERIDIYTNTLEGVRTKIIELAHAWGEK